MRVNYVREDATHYRGTSVDIVVEIWAKPFDESLGATNLVRRASLKLRSTQKIEGAARVELTPVTRFECTNSLFGYQSGMDGRSRARICCTST